MKLFHNHSAGVLTQLYIRDWRSPLVRIKVDELLEIDKILALRLYLN